MNKHTELLVEVKEQGIWGRIKSIVKRLFYKKNRVENKAVKIDNHLNMQVAEKNINFMQGQDLALLELQKKYRTGEIKESDLAEEQLKALCDLYDKQINGLRASNEVRKQRLLKYREKMNITNV